jgi:hypothetical protein
MANPQPSDDHDALRRLEARLDRAAEATERLIAEAAGAAFSGSGADPEDATRPPPAGWQQPGPASRAPQWLNGDEIELLMGLLGSLRDRIPPELQQRLTQAVREVLLALRALIDWYLERSERRRSEPDEVQDIPIL